MFLYTVPVYPILALFLIWEVSLKLTNQSSRMVFPILNLTRVQEFHGNMAVQVSMLLNLHSIIILIDCCSLQNKQKSCKFL